MGFGDQIIYSETVARPELKLAMFMLFGRQFITTRYFSHLLEKRAPLHRCFRAIITPPAEDQSRDMRSKIAYLKLQITGVIAFPMVAPASRKHDNRCTRANQTRRGP